MTAPAIKASPPVFFNAFDGALWCADRGLPVFRVVPSGKVPYRSGINEATTDPATIKGWFAENPRLNYAVDCSDLIVVDVDPRKDEDGWFGELNDLGDLPDTLQVISPSGGFHLYFDACGFDASQAPLSPCIDIRARGGYVVGPGSQIEGKRYRLHNDFEIAPVPPHLAERLKKRGERVADNSTPAAELDTPGAKAYAETYIRDTQGAEQGDRNRLLFRHACVLKDKGLSFDFVHALLVDEWCPKCDPPYDDAGEIEASVASAYANGQRQPGIEAAELEFEPLGELDSKPKPDPFGQSAAQWIGVDPQPSKFTIDKIVPEGFVTLLAAAGGRGKSLVSLQAMICVAAGVPFLGYDVAQGGAAIFCEDEPDELHRRTKAICTQLGVEFEQVAANLWPASHVGRDAILWTNDGGIEGKLEAIRSAVAARPGLKLLVLDGVSFLFAAPEYDRGQVTRFIVALTKIAQAYGVAVVLIHHESKTNADDDVFAASGSTAWINACRSVLKLGAVEKDPDKRTLQHIKSNRGPRQLPITCRVDGGGFVSLGGDLERRNAAIEAVQRLMRQAAETNVNLSPNDKARGLYGRKWMFDHQGDTEFTPDEFGRAIGDLLSFGILEVELYENKGKSCARYKLCVSDTSPTDPIPTHPDT